MPGPKGYSSYHGRRSALKAVAAVLLVLVILGAAAFMLLQRYIVYDADGSPGLRLPGDPPAGDVSAPPEPPPVEVDLTIQELERQPVRAYQLPAGPLEAWDASSVPDGSCNAVAYTVKDRAGSVFFDSRTAVEKARLPAGTAASAVAAMMAQEELRTVAVLSCFRDSTASRADQAGLSLETNTGRVFYDAENENWLDPGKEGARQYLCAIAVECAALGFDEILLTDLGYPTRGRLSRVEDGGGDRLANTALFLREMRAALPEETVLSVELPPQVMLDGADETAGLDPAQIAGGVDQLYAEAGDAAAARLLADAAAALGGGTPRFIPVFSALPAQIGETSGYLIRTP